MATTTEQVTELDWRAVDRARYAAEIESEIESVAAGWEAQKARELRQRASITAGERVRGRILHDHAVAMDGPYGAETLAAEGLQAVAHVWPDCPGLKVPKSPDERWRPTHVKAPWVLTADGVCRRAWRERRSIPSGEGTARSGLVPNKVLYSGEFLYQVCGPVWPLGVDRGVARYAVRTRKGWGVEEIPLTQTAEPVAYVQEASVAVGVDPVGELLGRRGVHLNPEQWRWIDVGAATGAREARSIDARSLFLEFLTDAQRAQTHP